MNESYLLGLMDHLEAGVTEIGMHPALSLPPELEKWAPDYEYQEEFKALTSAGVKEKIQTRAIRLVNYHFLTAGSLTGRMPFVLSRPHPDQ
jgi:hypothetical protein